MQPSKITDRFTSMRDKVDMRSIRFHDLRHANVSEQLAAGIDPATVSARAGHASTRMTLDRYAHALPASGTAAAAVMGRCCRASNRQAGKRSSASGISRFRTVCWT